MIIADTMAWADFISHGDDHLQGLLTSEATLLHPYRGVGLVHAHLLASALLPENARLWTRDPRLLTVAARLGIAYPAA